MMKCKDCVYFMGACNLKKPADAEPCEDFELDPVKKIQSDRSDMSDKKVDFVDNSQHQEVKEK